MVTCGTCSISRDTNQLHSYGGAMWLRLLTYVRREECCVHVTVDATATSSGSSMDRR